MKSQATLAEHVGALWLTPQMDRLFLEGPGARRRFLDRLVFDTDPAHAGRVNAYEHAMRERMRLLRAGAAGQIGAGGQTAADAGWLASLEDTMATRGVAVAAARLDVARRVGSHLAAGTGAFPGAAIEAAGIVETWLGEGPALAAEDRLRDRLAQERDRDAAEGRTATGPHKSDLKVRHLGNGQAAELCSTGEQKALLVALVLGTARMRTQERGTAPLLLLDEIAAHLDARRLGVLFDEIGAVGGSFMNLVYPYFLEEKGWNGPQYRKVQVYDLLLGIVAMIILNIAVWILGAELLYPDRQISNLDDLPNLLSDVLGPGGRLLFYLGVFSAVFTSIVGHAVGLAALGSHSFLWWKTRKHSTRDDRRAHPTHRAIILWCLISPLIWTIPGMPDFVTLTLAANSAQVVLIPLVAGGIWRITAGKQFIGEEHQNHWWENLVMGFLFVLALYGAFRSFGVILGY